MAFDMGNTLNTSMEKLIGIVATLRGPDGCPWDRDQTPQTLQPFLVEETYEVLDSLESSDWFGLKEELGDLLFQIVLHSQIMREAGEFDISDVIDGICKKMERRHPHVFGDSEAKNTEAVRAQWSKIKAMERRERAKGKDGSDYSVLAGVPHAAPALIQAQRLGEKAASVGFDWLSAKDVFQKVEEEIVELSAELVNEDRSYQEHELGDLLFALTNLARHLGIDSESSLRKANKRFNKRFRYIEQKVSDNNNEIETTPAARLEELWLEAKQKLG